MKMLLFGKEVKEILVQNDSLFLNSLPSLRARATTAQPVETHMAKSQWPVLGVSASADEGHATYGNCSDLWAAPTSWRTEKKGSGYLLLSSFSLSLFFIFLNTVDLMWYNRYGNHMLETSYLSC